VRKSLSPDFWERAAELWLAIEGKILGELIVGTEVQTNLGPNAYLMTVGGLGVFKTHVAKPSTGLVIASTDMVAADAVAMVFLVHCYRETPWWPRFLQKILILMNGQIQELGKEGVYDNRFIKRAVELDLGKRVEGIDAEGVPPELLQELERAVL
jgi:hypothetical protein